MEESPSKERTKLALFDFDGTLTVRDSMLAFIEFVDGKWSLYWSLLMLSPILVLTKLGYYNAEKAKKKLLRRHFLGMKEDILKKAATRFCMTQMSTIFRDEGLEKLAFHRSKGHKVVVVSASLDLWIMPWLQEQNLMGICTEMAWEDGVFMGEFATPNCNGPEKARRILAALNLDDYERIYAYGDSSKGDKEMFALAHKVFFRRFL
jgi:phosphatidylglycerophosphatase C